MQKNATLPVTPPLPKPSKIKKNLKFILILFLCAYFGLVHSQPHSQPTNQNIAKAAKKQVGLTFLYDPTYTRLPYPHGDVPLIKGVCSDVVVRALREVGMDLQQLIHEDMQAHFKNYPQIWGLKRPDSNIDHRRVPNLDTYFKRRGFNLPITLTASDYVAGDIVAWRLNNNLTHIGVVSSTVSKNKRPYVIHNIGLGARNEDVLFKWKITGHYRVFKK